MTAWVNTFQVNHRGNNNDQIYCYTMLYGSLRQSMILYSVAVLLKYLYIKFGDSPVHYRFTGFLRDSNVEY